MYRRARSTWRREPEWRDKHFMQVDMEPSSIRRRVSTDRLLRRDVQQLVVGSILIHTTSLDTVSAVPLLSTAVPVRSGDLQLRIYAKNAAAVGRPFEHTYNGIYAVFFWSTDINIFMNIGLLQHNSS